MSALIGDLVDTDPSQVGELVVKLLNVIPDPGDDRSDRAPGNAHQFSDRALGCLGGQPGDLRVEVMSVTDLVTGPGHRRDCHPVGPTRHPGSVGFQVDLDGPDVQGLPATSPRASVIAWTTSLTRSAPVAHRSRRPDRSDQHPALVVEVDILDHRFLDTEQHSP